MYRLLLCSLLAGCIPQDTRPIKEGIQTATITIIRDNKAVEICLSKTTVPIGFKIHACSERTLINCFIYLKPDAGDELWGHELRHCIDGAWHL